MQIAVNKRKANPAPAISSSPKELFLMLFSLSKQNIPVYSFCSGNAFSVCGISLIEALIFMDVSQLIKEAKNESAAAQKCLFDLFADKINKADK